MVLPKDAFTLSGGCNCRAVRYRVIVQAFQNRSPNPYRTPGSDIGDLRVLFVAICHCNDCRRASANILPHVLVTDITGVNVALVATPARTSADDKRIWEEAESVFDFTNASIRTNTTLAVYKSSPQRSRWFCNNCGTPLGYSVDDGVIPEEWKWPKMLDLWLGTLDRESLEQEYMKPERKLWCHYGILGSEILSDHGSRTPCHPLTKSTRYWAVMILRKI